MTLIFPVPKSPHTAGRIGPTRCQDWYRAVVRSVALAEASSSPAFLIVTAFYAAHENREAIIYGNAIRALVPNAHILVIPQGLETVEQIEVALAFAKQTRQSIYLVSTLLHFPRVWWLARGNSARHRVVVGIPRPREAVTDIVLAFLFPLLDLAGLRQWFLYRARRRRQRGKI